MPTKPKSKPSITQVVDSFRKKSVKLHLKKLDKTLIHLEGDATSLEFLGKLLLTLAKSDSHSLQLSPSGAGNTYFAKTSSLGLYIQKLPQKSL